MNLPIPLRPTKQTQSLFGALKPLGSHSHSVHPTQFPSSSLYNQSQFFLFKVSRKSHLHFYLGACLCAAFKYILCQGFRCTHLGTTTCTGFSEQSYHHPPLPQALRGYLGMIWGRFICAWLSLLTRIYFSGG